ncbi:competence protein ComEA [Candidatus Shapirobacteria bacterium CG09_land_8_20_14_0_10_38_17]|uniref:Competence protein ComEA n=1 Tax=Candidatus Shapirobacteria bacterium CG09_land_8_20_14_0_10_38_17 TaxID=1974884 RepID=A0A2H0WQZ3_9BACT|nr:MAG: competence protein ComEA [Candidatus Shapirobacteria bacterium CG09_land_8_20_14_0_10_38_17]
MKESILESVEKVDGEEGFGFGDGLKEKGEGIDEKSFWEFLKDNVIEWVMVSIGITLILIGLAQHFHWLEDDINGVSIIRADKGSATISSEAKEGIVVDVAGAVVKPGVYQLDSGSRVNDLLIACGGLTQWASRRFIEKDLNRARLMSDGEKIYIPYIGEETAIAVSSVQSDSSTKININKAAIGELESLPGIGFAYASAIIEYRQDKGNFSSVEEIKNVPGIGEKTFEKIKNSIIIN